jgi:hypothetical protein
MCYKFFSFTFLGGCAMAGPGMDWEKQWAKINVKAWSDENFKKRLMSNPKSALQEMGITPPAGMEVKVVENTNTVVHLPLYAKPQSGELAEEDLMQVAGGQASTCSASYWPSQATTQLKL